MSFRHIRCQEELEKGHCTRRELCPYAHRPSAPVSLPPPLATASHQEYDPSNPIGMDSVCSSPAEYDPTRPYGGYSTTPPATSYTPAAIPSARDDAFNDLKRRLIEMKSSASASHQQIVPPPSVPQPTPPPNRAALVHRVHATGRAKTQAPLPKRQVTGLPNRSSVLNLGGHCGLKKVNKPAPEKKTEEKPVDPLSRIPKELRPVLDYIPSAHIKLDQRRPMLDKYLRVLLESQKEGQTIQEIVDEAMTLEKKHYMESRSFGVYRAECVQELNRMIKSRKESKSSST